jgi:glycosyltransferase involved in cell wall biosynthesis
VIYPFAKEWRMRVIDGNIHVFDFSFGLGGRAGRFLNVFKVVSAIIKVIKDNDIDYIKVFEPYALGLLGVLLKFILKKKLVIFNVCNYDLMYVNTKVVPYGLGRLLQKIVLRIVFAFADAVVGANVHSSQFCIENGAKKGKVFTVYLYGIDRRFFNQRQDGRKFGHGDVRQILLCSRLSAEKYVFDVIFAVEELIRRGIKDVVLAIAGDGVQRKEIEQYIEKNNLERYVILLGFIKQDSLREMYYSSDITVSSLTGSALVEAALCERPIITYDIDWQRELIENHKSGLLVEFRDYKGMADAIQYLFDNPLLAKRMGRQSRLKAIELFHPDNIEKQEKKVLDFLKLS